MRTRQPFSKVMKEPSMLIVEIYFSALKNAVRFCSDLKDYLYKGWGGDAPNIC